MIEQIVPILPTEEHFIVSILPMIKDFGLSALLMVAIYFIFKEWMRCQKEGRDAMLDITKSNERISNILSNLEDRQAEIITKVNAIKDSVVELKGRKP